MQRVTAEAVEPSELRGDEREEARKLQADQGVSAGEVQQQLAGVPAA